MTRRTDKHTGIAEGIDDLVGLLLVVELPGLLEGAHGGRLCGGTVFLLAKFQAVKYKYATDAEVLEDLELLLDVAPQGEREAAQGAQQCLTGGLVDQVLGDVERRIDTDDSALYSREG